MENSNFNKFRLRDLRRERNITGVELGKIIDVSQQTISKWESGQKSPSKENLKKLSAYFHVSSDYLLGLTDEREPYKKPLKFEEALKILENTKRNDDIIKITNSIKNLNDEKLHALATIAASFELNPRLKNCLPNKLILKRYFVPSFVSYL